MSGDLPTCEGCARPVRSGEPGVWQFAEGWIQARAAGGANALALPVRKPRFLCDPCMEIRRAGGQQRTLL